MIQNKSALDFLRSLEDHSVEVVFSDPPYNAGKHYGNYKDNLPQDVYEQWMKDIVAESLRVSVRGVIFYVSCELTKFFWNIVPNSNLIPVHKKAAGVCKKNLAIQYHSIITNVSPTKRTRNLWDDVRLPGEGYFFKEPRYPNPGMTGFALTEKIIDCFTLTGDTVLDPFSGCGTTWAACEKLGRKFMGSEQNLEYIEIANQRIGALQESLV